jgi:hypothetical protein
MRPASLLFAVLAGLALTAPAAAQDSARRAPPARGAYFVEFRARTGGMLGHTFIVYGRVDGSGRERELHYAGLYPADAWERALMTLGPLVTAPAYVGVENKDRHLAPIASYRVSLNANEFARMTGTVHRLQMSRPRWNLVFYNCNDFVTEVARSIGMRTPPGLVSPKVYVRSLRAMNRS